MLYDDINLYMFNKINNSLNFSFKHLWILNFCNEYYNLYLLLGYGY